MTDAEQLLWSHLRNRQLLGLQFNRQKPVGPYVVDFYSASARLVIEVDGSRHLQIDHATRDAVRDLFLQEHGLLVLRFDDRQVLLETAAVLEKILLTCEQRANPPCPRTGKGDGDKITPPGLVLMTADPIGGVWNYALELSRGLASHGVRVALATMGRPLSPEQRREVADEGNVTLCESGYRLEWMDDPWRDVERGGKWLLSLEAELKPDLVHLNGYVHAALPWQSPCLVVAHSCVLSWWQAVRGGEAPEGLREYRDKVTRGLAAADLVAAPSAAMLEAIRRLYLPLPDARVVYNARARTRFRPGRKEDFILAVGRLWDDAKNISSLVKTAYDLPWPVYVAGEINRPDGGGAAVEGVNRLGVMAADALAPWYAAAAVYALPARYEPFGLTVLEAAQSGCALVLGDIPSLRELWDGAALFVDPESPGELRGELLALCADRNRQAALGEKALERSRSFSAARMTAGYLELYGRLCGGAPCSSS